MKIFMDDEDNCAVHVVAIFPEIQNQASLIDIFAHTNWKLILCGTIREARICLADRRVGVVLTNSSLPDGDWRDVLHLLPVLETTPSVLVALTSPNSSQWAEVLNLGGYDALIKPFDREEVVRLISLAWLFWRDSQVHSIREQEPATMKVADKPMLTPIS